MRARISVIIPTLNAGQALAACFGALMEGVEQGLIRELIVSDGGSDDATVTLAQGWGGEVVHGAPSRGGQLQRGVAVAQGEWLLILHADTALQAGWSEAVQAHLADPEAAGWFRLAFDARGFAATVVAGWANLRSRLGLPYGDQGMLIHRDLYAAVGGYPDQPLMEDVALARQLRGKLCGLDAVAVTSAAKYKQQGWLNRGARNLITLVRYCAGTSPEVLSASYNKRK
ncbi:TIGR04283 family arsenosugar biosynthesis glycosyltransferase [Sulfitobacter sp. F26169L]|uniref:TIGR04283 family arsenosugar biosynthesis glycosyltransferase n=1 Tax=Sulfitobacter sp. F26169L TaxID=2996015 RepID=UPI002260885E|nr:TIGR04283 family arsenosugar biosynthesis glycosyltransferase [Sulfitobacter sp. F26169L]MCX7566508.1 TIGR04283 family arsenosugar biosynthesis glycosyltransferase [Sulfitobacter sp. F26169L]